MEREKHDKLHGDNEKNEAEQKRQDATPDTTKKVAGTTSAFSAATDTEDGAIEKSEDTIGNP